MDDVLAETVAYMVAHVDEYGAVSLKPLEPMTRWGTRGRDSLRLPNGVRVEPGKRVRIRIVEDRDESVGVA